jgi:hypothetical protein
MGKVGLLKQQLCAFRVTVTNTQYVCHNFITFYFTVQLTQYMQQFHSYESLHMPKNA